MTMGEINQFVEEYCDIDEEVESRKPFEVISEQHLELLLTQFLMSREEINYANELVREANWNFRYMQEGSIEQSFVDALEQGCKKYGREDIMEKIVAIIL